MEINGFLDIFRYDLTIHLKRVHYVMVKMLRNMLSGPEDARIVSTKFNLSQLFKYFWN